MNEYEKEGLKIVAQDVGFGLIKCVVGIIMLFLLLVFIGIL